MSYIGNQPGGLGKAERFIFTCTGTTPTITHDSQGVPISYVVNQISVYLNGIKQVIPTDVAASTGSSLVFAADLTVGDVVEAIALSTFNATAVDSSSIVSGAIDLAHMSSESVDEDNLHISNAGSNGQFLSKQSGNAGGLTWADAAGGATSGMINNVWRWNDTSSGGVSINSTTITVATDAKSFSATSGRHYIISGMQVAQPHRTGDSAEQEKFQNQYLYYGMTERNITDTTTDTLLFFSEIGADHDADSTRPAADFWIFSYIASFTATSNGDHYVYTAIASYMANIQARAYNDATHPHHTIVMEVMP